MTSHPHIVELVPLLLAFPAVFYAGTRYAKLRRLRDKVINAMSIGCAVLLIVAQTSWYTTTVILNRLEDAVYINTVWTVFNSLVMVLIILISLPRK